MTAVRLRAGRARLWGLAAVLALLAVALVVGVRGRGSAAPAQDPALAAARAASGLPPCPPGLTPDLPVRTLACYAGGDVRVAAAPGRPTLVNLWATWCPPCVDEVPALVQFARQAGDRVRVVGVVQQDSAASVYAFARQFGVDYPLLADPDGVTLRHYGPGPPITLLVRPDGTVAYVQRGALVDAAAVAAAVRTHLGVQV